MQHAINHRTDHGQATRTEQNILLHRHLTARFGIQAIDLCRNGIAEKRRQIPTSQLPRRLVPAQPATHQNLDQ
jgi:uncharacterized membrane protein YcjF (UPF0283 family)